ncbi:MAG: DEAD/DEAH box helicase [Lachnospiraceae bacterium]|nr:DEAD/DEAH box helicase [Lachnospiraceae bacterium]
MISLSEIRSKSSAPSYTRGNQVYLHKKIHDMEFSYLNDHVLTVHALVDGSYSTPYETDITYDEHADEITDYSCSCPAAYTYSGMCKHCVGLALLCSLDMPDTTQQTQKLVKMKPVQINTDPELEHLLYARSMAEKAQYFQPAITGEVELEPTFSYKPYEGWSVSFRIGAEQKYVLKDIREFILHLEGREKYTYGKKLSFIHERSVFTEEAKSWIDYLTMRVQKEQNESPYAYGRYHFYESAIKRNLSLNDMELTELLYSLCPTHIMMAGRGSKTTAIQVVDKDPRIKLELTEHGDGYQLVLPAVEMFRGNKKLCILKDNIMYCCSEEYLHGVGGLLELTSSDFSRNYAISAKDMNTFCQVILPDLEKYTKVKKPQQVQVFTPEPCEIRIYLDEQDNRVTGTIQAWYGETSFNLLDPVSVEGMYRDIAQEVQAFNTLRQYFLYMEKTDYLYLKKEDEDQIYQLISTGINQLQQLGTVYVSDSIKRLQLLRRPKLKVGVSLQAGLLELSIDSEGLSAADIDGILANYRRRKKYYRLANGEFLQLEDNGITALAELADGLDLNSEQLTSGHLQLPGYRAFYLDQVLREHDSELSVKRTQEFKAAIRNLKDVEDSDYEIPDSLQADLRSYQKFGYRWLCTLDQMSFGGILADDMGLGKTLQMITFFLAKKQQHALRALIVCPASLVYNWESEINRFAPELSVLPVVGQAGERKELLAREADIYLTSYDLLKRDILEYQKLSFDYCTIDEAQNIKNHTTQAARAVKGIQARVRFALTGTPIENTLSELWSIFDFLMPGILNSYKNFKTEYEFPIATTSDETISNRLKKMIRPFILRRLKKDVLKELPDKLEKVVYSKMDSTQRELYEATVKKTTQSLAQKTAEEFRQGKIQFLAELTRLRQICCDPSLVYENYKGDSAKLETCISLLTGAVSSGNKVLVFSQFTSMLAIIEQRLQAEQISYYCLTGSTSKEKRQELVDAFQEDTTPVFLISLKAGGTGLNLTAANIVIHFDPWWNMAAQNQATDRVHRIGQEQIVTVYKLITKNTLEEKILKLQEKKASLSDQIMSDGSITDSLATKEDFMEILQF